MGWLDLSNVSNIFRQSYVNGFLDVSRTLIVRGDASLNGNLFIAGDVSLNGNLRANYPNSSIPPSAIIGGVSTGIFINDISASKRMVVAGDVSFNSNLFVAGDVSFNGNLRANYPDSTIPPTAIIGGVSTGIFINDISASKRMVVAGDVSLNSKLFVAGDVSLNGSVSIGNDITIGGRLNVKNYTNQNIINTTTTNYQLIVSEDISLNGRLVVSGDSSFNGNVYTTGFITAATQSITDNSTRVATTEYARSLVDTSLNNALANYSTKSVIDSSLALYSTKAAVDTSLGLYYTKTAIDASVNTNYYNKSTIDASVNTNYYNKSTIDASINTNYYNKSTIDASVNNVLVNNYSTKSVIDTSLALYYTKTESDASMNTNYYNKSTIDASVNTNYYNKSTIDASVNTNYYNKSTIDASVNNLLANNYTTKSVIDASLALYYTKTAIDASVNTILALKANLASPTFTGIAVIPTGNLTTLNVFGDASLNGNLQCLRDITVNTYTIGRGATGNYSNTVFGVDSLRVNTSGIQNIAMGYFALKRLTTGNDNVSIGYNNSQYLTTGNSNTGIGAFNLGSLTTGSANMAIGSYCLGGITTQSDNVGIGKDTLAFVSTSNNTAIGSEALRESTSGSNNTAIGYQAGKAGVALTTGSNNTLLGYQAQANANNYNNSTALGAGATITESNQVVLGTASEKVVMPGDASLNGNIVIGRNLTVLGNIAVQNYTNQSIINTTTTNYQLIVSEDISLNGRLVVSSDTSLNANLFIGRDLSLNGNLYVKSINVKDISGVNNFFGNLQYTYNTPNTATFDANGFAILKNIDSSATVIYSTIDMSINGNLFVGNDLSYAGNLYVKPNSIDSNAIRYGINNQFGVFQYNYTTPNTASYDSEGFGILRYIDSSSQVLYSKTDLSLSGMLNVSTDTSLNGNVYIGKDISANGNIVIGKDISANGNIVIGKNLIVLGNIAVKNYTNQSIINTTTTNYQLIVSEDISLNGRLFVSNNIGIGTTAPAASLHIYEPTGRAATTTAASIVLEHGNAGGTSSILFKSVTNAGSDYGYIYYVDDITDSTTGERSALCIGVENDGGTSAVADVLVLNRNGSHVGIGMTNPSTLLHVNGTTTSSTFNATSDYRLKDNITNLDETYIIDHLRPVKYTFKSNNSQQIGFIAHEIQEHYPMLVDGEKDGQTHQSINMNGIIPLLVNDLKRSKERIAELETRMKNLEEQLSRMI